MQNHEKHEMYPIAKISTFTVAFATGTHDFEVFVKALKVHTCHTCIWVAVLLLIPLMCIQLKSNGKTINIIE